jgi:hypothetical protein
MHPPRKVITVGPVIGAKVYRQDVVVKRAGFAKQPPERVDGDIMNLSRKSLRRLAFTASNTAVDFVAMLTLTYPEAYPVDGRICKRHLNTLLTRLRQKYTAVSYLWFMEFQKRGAPHFHILVDRFIPHDWLAEAWYKIVDSGDEKHLQAGTQADKIRSQNGAKHYVVKYAAKCNQKAVPIGFRRVGRYWGASRNVKPQPVGTIDINESQLYQLLIESNWGYVENVKGKPVAILYNAAPGIVELVARPPRL